MGIGALKRSICGVTIIMSIGLLISCQQKPVEEPIESSTDNQPNTKISASANKDAIPKVVKEKIEMKNIIVISNSQQKGTVKFFNLEGGFFGIVTAQGQKLLPMNLDKEYRQDGAKIEFTGSFEKGVATFQQWGRPYKIRAIKLLKPGQSEPNS